MEGDKQKNPSKSSKTLKKMIPQLLISVSLFSFVLSYSSLSSSLSSSSSSPKLHRYFSSGNFSFTFHLLSKNCLFLICNGLLVFLSKTAGFIHPPTDLNDVLHFKITDNFHSYADEFDHRNADDEVKNPEQVSILIAESDHDEKPEKDDQNQATDCTSCWLFDDDHGDRLYGHHEDEGEEEEEEEMMSTEELNQKFEDFIRKMKEEIIINEDRHKLLLLN